MIGSAFPRPLERCVCEACFVLELVCAAVAAGAAISTSSSQLRAIVGGVVGGYFGAMVVVGLVVLLALQRRHKRAQLELASKSAKKTTGARSYKI